jgi:beta-lactamase regulating signal transducer with metallopeptidase domain
MNSMQLLTGPVVEALGWALLHLLWQGALVAGILAAALSLLSRRSANVRYMTACVALALLPALATVTAMRAYQPPPAAVAVAPAQVTVEAAAPALTLPIMITPTPVEPDSSLATVLSTARAYLPVVVLLWLAGVALLATRLVISWTRVQRMTRDRARTAAAVWNASVTRLSAALGLRRAVRLLESVAVEVPTVIGWLRPVILLPAATLAGLSPEQIEMLLAHELAHIRRHDFFINLMQALVETLMFYHPAVWWISQRVRIERENCCDDLAVRVCGNPVQYARALTRLEELRAGVQYAAVGANGGSLVARIRRLVATQREGTGFTSRWTAGAAVLAVLIALVTIPSLPLFANHEDQKAPKAQQQSANPPSSEVDVNATDGDDATDADTDSDTPAVAPAPSPRPSPAPMAALAPIAQAVDEGVDDAMDDVEVDVDDDTDDVETKKFGASGQLTVDELIALRSNGVTPEYIQKMRSASLGELTLGQILVLASQGVTPEYINELRGAGIDVKEARELAAMASQGVTADYVRQMKASGYSGLTSRELIGLKSQGVSPSYVKSLADAGYRNLTARELIALASQGVTTSFIKALGDAGYTKLSVRDIVRLAASGVNADFIRQMSQYHDKK